MLPRFSTTAVDEIYAPNENPVLAEDADQTAHQRLLIVSFYTHGDDSSAVVNRLVFFGGEFSNGRGASTISAIDRASVWHKQSKSHS